MNLIKHYSLTFFLLCGFALTSTASDNQPKISSFFAKHLNGDKSYFTESKKLKNKEIDKYRDLVWDAWKEANNNSTEEKLIELNPLSETTNSKWKLPQELEKDAIMPYYWGSKGDKPANGYPMYLYMHGSGPKENEWATGLRICSQFDDAPSAYFIPQIPNMGEYYRWYQKAKQFAWEKLLRQAYVSGNIDPNHVYFFGISEGGYGSQRLASFYADYLAGAGPMAGGEPLRNAPPENCANIAFSLRTGDKDTGFYRNILSTRVKETFDSLQALHPGLYKNFIELIPGMGHSIDYKPTTPWLKQFTRNPYPKYFSWENFEMDGNYRNGFYNLYVNERSNENTDSRTFYEMKIDGNNISLRVDEVVYETTEKDPRWGIEMRFVKKYTPATKGKVTIYLNDQLVDLNKKVNITVNGKKIFSGKVKVDLKNMVNSCAAFFDPCRIYPAAVEVEL